jgi:single-strand DNA-binding protein
MLNLNSCSFAGRLCSDPRVSENGTIVAAWTLAINRRWKAKDGEHREETTFVPCKCFGRNADFARTYLRKGTPIWCDGRMETHRWTSADGTEKERLELVVNSIQFTESQQRDEDC